MESVFIIDQKELPMEFGHKPISTYRRSVMRQAQEFISIITIIENHDEQARLLLRTCIIKSNRYSPLKTYN